MNLKLIGGRIKKARLNKGLTQLELSEAVNISSVHLSHIETGRISMSLDCLLRVCEVLEITPDYVLINEYKIKDKKSGTNFSEYFDNLTDDEIAFVIETIKTLSLMKINRNERNNKKLCE